MSVKILHITLSILLFLSSTGLKINSHFCTGQFKYSTLFVQPKNCCAKVQGHYPSKDSCQDEANQTPCCQNKANLFKSNFPQNINAESAQNVDFPTFDLAINYILKNRQIHFQRFAIDYSKYRPPLIRQNFSILYQVFRC